MKLTLVSSRTRAGKLHELGKLARFQGPSTDGFSASPHSSGSMSYLQKLKEWEWTGSNPDPHLAPLSCVSKQHKRQKGLRDHEGDGD